MLIVDRLVEKIAVCEDENRTMIELDIKLLPEDVKEGDCIQPDEFGGYYILEEETQRRKDRLMKLLKRLQN